MNGERDEMIEILVGYESRMLRYAQKILRAEPDAEDAVQCVILEVLNGPDIVGRVERLGAWLMTLVYRRCVDVIRRRARAKIAVNSEEVLSTLIAHESSTDTAESMEIRTAIAEALATLPEQQREAILMNVIDGFSFREISDQTGIPMGTLMARKKRGIEHIRESLNKRGFGEDACS